jgi:hypothetical protein
VAQLLACSYRVKLLTKHLWGLPGVIALAVLTANLRADTTRESSELDATRIETQQSQPDVTPAANAQATVVEKSPPTPVQIAGWISDLDDNRYLTREAATHKLLESGADSLDALLATANGDRPEPADRATWILRRLGNSKDHSLRRPALERLALLQNRPQIAGAAKQALAELRHNEAVEAIQRLGGRYIANEYGMAVGMYFTPRVVLDHQWRGTDADLALLRDLVAVRQVIIIGTDVSLEGLTHLQHVNLLSDLLIYGTKLEPEDLPKVQKMLPQVAVDYRRGGLLGVGTNAPDSMGAAVVGIVTKGSVAEAAGIQVGDIIHKFEGQPVPNFKALTVMIGKHRPGDEVKLEALRSGQTIEFKVKLGAWETVN